MLKFSTHFKLNKTQKELDFIDICLNTDNELFIDPKLIEKTDDKRLQPMKKALKSFSQKLFLYVARNDRKSANKLFEGLAEPNETKLGYSSGKPKGNAMGEILKAEFLDAIFDLEIIKEGKINSIGELELFISNVACDRISDTVTKVIKQQLIDFTIEQCNLHDIKGEECSQRDVYNLATGEWNRDKFTLPHFNEEPIILVPKSIVRRQKDGNSSLNFFFRFAFRNFIKDDYDFTKDLPKKGRDGKTTYKDFYKDLKDKGKSKKKEAEKWVKKHGNIVIEFRSKLNDENRLNSLSDKEISTIVDSKCAK